MSPPLIALSMALTASSTPPSSSRVSSFGVCTHRCGLPWKRSLRGRGPGSSDVAIPEAAASTIEAPVVAAAARSSALIHWYTTIPMQSRPNSSPGSRGAGAGPLVGERAGAPRAIDVVVPTGRETVFLVSSATPTNVWNGSNTTTYSRRAPYPSACGDRVEPDDVGKEQEAGEHEVRMGRTRAPLVAQRQQVERREVEGTSWRRTTTMPSTGA